MPGVKRATSPIMLTPLSSRSLPLNAAIEIGTDWTDSARLRAVTTICSSRWLSLSLVPKDSPPGCDAAKPPCAANDHDRNTADGKDPSLGFIAVSPSPRAALSSVPVYVYLFANNCKAPGERGTI